MIYAQIILVCIDVGAVLNKYHDMCTGRPIYIGDRDLLFRRARAEPKSVLAKSAEIYIVFQNKISSRKKWGTAFLGRGGKSHTTIAVPPAGTRSAHSECQHRPRTTPVQYHSGVSTTPLVQHKYRHTSYNRTMPDLHNFSTNTSANTNSVPQQYLHDPHEQNYPMPVKIVRRPPPRPPPARS